MAYDEAENPFPVATMARFVVEFGKGVCDVADLRTLAAANGLALDQIVPMPANNTALVFARAERQN